MAIKSHLIHFLRSDLSGYLINQAGFFADAVDLFGLLGQRPQELLPDLPGNPGVYLVFLEVHLGGNVEPLL
jgi:hypothetical protein